MNENDQSKLAELINKSEITSVVNSYFRALDDKDFSAQHFAAILTPQAKVTRPNGASLTGPEEISASHEKSFARFEGSQHLLSGHDISVDADTAIVRANLVAMHIWQGSNTNANNVDNFFVAGGRHPRRTGADRWPMENVSAANRCRLACGRIQGHDADRQVAILAGEVVRHLCREWREPWCGMGRLSCCLFDRERHRHDCLAACV